MGRSINSNLNKKYILDKVSQISIFSVYFDIPVALIQHCIDTGELILSPIRIDNHPTVGFRYDNKGKLKYRCNRCKVEDIHNDFSNTLRLRFKGK